MISSLKKKIQHLTTKYIPEVVSIRRHLHQYPELSYQEYQTAAYIAQKIEEKGIHIQKNIAKTGLLATIQGKNPKKKKIMLRADIDALPIKEKNVSPYTSKHSGVMHACGHDVHTASLIGVIYVLETLKDNFEGTIQCIFQPGEEQLPGGASLMIKEKILENPTPSLIIGQHVDPTLPVGTVGFTEGYAMASGDVLHLKVQGKGGHAAMPHTTINPIILSAHIVLALQQIVNNYRDPLHPTVLSFGKIQAGEAENIIPNHAIIQGILRTFDTSWRKEAHKKIIQIAQHTAQAGGGDCVVTIQKGYPALYNDPHWHALMMHAAGLYIEKKHIQKVPLLMTTEDFAYYTQKIPGCFYRIGVGNAEKYITPLHTDTFDVDESVFKTSIALMSWLAIQALQNIHT